MLEVYDLMLSTDLKNGKVESDAELKTVQAANLKFNDHPKPVSSLSVNVTSRREQVHLLTIWDDLEELHKSIVLYSMF